MRTSVCLLICAAAVCWANIDGIEYQRLQGSTTTPTYDCVGKKDGSYPDADDCHCFFMCVDERSYFFRCPNGTAFLETAHQCEDQRKVPSCKP